jgi:hypothetical protein
MIDMLRQERRFTLLLMGNVLSRIGDGVHEFVFIITVLKVTGNGIGDAGVVYFFRFIPDLLLGPVGGALSDRLSRKALTMSATALGTIFGAIACARIARDFTTRRLMSYWCLYGVAMSVLPFCATATAMIPPGCMIVGAIGALVDVVLPTNIQRLSNDQNMGKEFQPVLDAREYRRSSVGRIRRRSRHVFTASLERQRARVAGCFGRVCRATPFSQHE